MWGQPSLLPTSWHATSPQRPPVPVVHSAPVPWQKFKLPLAKQTGFCRGAVGGRRLGKVHCEFWGWVQIRFYVGHDEVPVAAFWRLTVFNIYGWFFSFCLTLCRSMRAAPWIWPARSPSGCRASSACFSWGLTSTQLINTVCVPRLRGPRMGGLEQGRGSGSFLLAGASAVWLETGLETVCRLQPLPDALFSPCVLDASDMEGV